MTSPSLSDDQEAKSLFC
uniref:Uncharacterized protein n=1 Tax=Anguilla anguilla TaxID=7936 RepID=A0A0E9W0Q0_ANGAN